MERIETPNHLKSITDLQMYRLSSGAICTDPSLIINSSLSSGTVLIGEWLIKDSFIHNSILIGEGSIKKSSVLNTESKGSLCIDNTCVSSCTLNGDINLLYNCKIERSDINCDITIQGNVTVRWNIHSHDDITIVGPCGRSGRLVSFNKDVSKVRAGCFSGNFYQFKRVVRKKYGKKSSYEKAIKLMESKLEEKKSWWKIW